MWLSGSLPSILALCPDHGFFFSISSIPRERSSSIAILCGDDVLLLKINRDVSVFVLFLGGFFTSILIQCKFAKKQVKKTSLLGKSFFVASKSAGREGIMRDPDWTAELVRDVHGARGVGVSMRLSLLLSLKFSGRMLLMHLDCSRSEVPQKY